MTQPLLAISAATPAFTFIAAVAEGVGLAAPGVTASVAGVAVAGLLAAHAAATMSPSLQWHGRAICRAGSSRPWVGLTFDDGPDPTSTARLVDALDAAGARATFFVLMDRVRAHPELLRRMAARHEVGLHGEHHDASLVFRHPRTGAQELRAAADELSDRLGSAVRWYRPPFGVTSPRLHEAVQRAGLQTVWCSVRTWDGVSSTVKRLRARCRTAGAGDIVLLHEGRRPARVALPSILSELAERGLRPETVGRLVAG